MSAKDILLEACQCDRAGRILQAQHLYKDGILVLLATAEGKCPSQVEFHSNSTTWNVLCLAEINPVKRAYFIGKIEEYKARLELIREKINAHSTKGDVVDNIPIMEGSTGHSYRQLFGKYLDNEVKEVELDEAYLMENHQVCKQILECVRSFQGFSRPFLSCKI